MAKQEAVRVTGLNKWFGDFQALKNVDLTVSHGERVVICGPSGSGKSTLVICINALEDHDTVSYTHLTLPTILLV